MKMNLKRPGKNAIFGVCPSKPRSISNLRIRSLPRIPPSINKSMLNARHGSRTRSVNKPKLKRIENALSVSNLLSNNYRAQSFNIDDELVKLNNITKKNYSIQEDLLFLRQRMIEVNTSAALYMKENLYNIKPFRLENIIQKSASSRVLASNTSLSNKL